MGSIRVWMRRHTRPREKPTTLTQLHDEGEKPSGPPSSNPPKMVWDEPQAANSPLNEDPQEAEGKGRGQRVRQWLKRAKGTLTGVAALFVCVCVTDQ